LHSFVSVVSDLKNLVLGLEKRVKVLEGGKVSNATPVIAPKKEAAKPAPKEDDDDGVDLFASDSDEEDTEAARIREERLAAYAAKKSKSTSFTSRYSFSSPSFPQSKFHHLSRTSESQMDDDFHFPFGFFRVMTLIRPKVTL